MADAPTRQVVLIVEDEALVRMAAVGMVEEAGFEVLEATNADEAILLLEARGWRIRIPRPDSQQAALQHGHGNGAAPNEGRRRDCPRLPLELP